jgi:hypothetical protein
VRLALAVALALVVPATASAATTVVDGPDSQIQKFGDLDVAPDGTGALAYSKRVGAEAHVFVARLTNGAWGAPVEVDSTLTPDDPTSIQVAAGNGGRVVVTYVNLAGAATGTVQSAVSTSSASGFQLAQVDAAPTAVDDQVDIDPASGVAYVVYDVTGGHVHAARWPGSGTAWTAVTLGAATDLEATAGTAGTGDDGSRVAVDSSGNAVIAWAEGAATTDQKALARRITGTTAATGAITLSATTLGTHPDAKETNMIDIDGGGSSNPWVVFRQGFTYPPSSIVVRNLARHLIGDTPSTPQELDGLTTDPKPTEGAEHPRIDVNAAGQGLAASARQLTNGVFGSALSAGNWTPGFQLNTDTNSAAPFPVAAVDDSGDGVIAWIDSAADPSTVLARTRIGGALGSPLTLSASGKGQIGGIAGGANLEAASSAAGTVSVGFAQGGANGGSQRVIVAATVSLPTSGGGGGGGGDKTPPTLSALRLSRKAFRIGTRLPHLSARKKPVGTRISFKVSEASKTTLTFQRVLSGRRVGKRCLAPTRRRAHRRHCTRYVAARPSLVYTTSAGAHRVTFQGRLTSRRKLRPGKYRLSVVSTDAAGNTSKPKTVRFTLLPAH